MTRQILWFTGGAEEGLFIARIAEALETTFGIQSKAITLYQRTRNRLASTHLTIRTVEEVVCAGGEIEAETEALIERAQTLVGEPGLGMLLHSDRLLQAVSDDELAHRTLAVTIIRLQGLLAEERYDVVLRYGTGLAIGRALTLLAAQASIPAYTLANAFPFDTCGLQQADENEQWRWIDFAPTWERWSTSEITDNDRKAAERFVQSYRDHHRARPPLKRSPPPETPLAQLKLKMKSLTRRILGMNRPPRVTVETHAGVLTAESLDQLLDFNQWQAGREKRSWRRTFSRFNYDESPDNFVYFPLNYSWDAPHRAWNPMNYLQEYIARIVWASLPVGYDLVLKEHPYGLGDPSHSALAELQREGLHIVDPRTHSLKLIEQSQAVFCVGDTTGWEAVMLQTPSIVYGARPWYTDAPFVWTVDAPNNVPRVMRRALARGASVYDRHDWVRFLRACMDSTHDGNIWGYKELVWENSNASDENIRKIANMIVACTPTAMEDQASGSTR